MCPDDDALASDSRCSNHLPDNWVAVKELELRHYNEQGP